MSRGTSTVFDHASRLFNIAGWQQRTLGNWDTGFCAVGALRTATGGHTYSNVVLYNDPDYQPALELLADLIGREECRIYRGLADAQAVITRWNDRPGRTKEEVLELFRRAAAVTRGVDEAELLGVLQRELVDA